MHPNCDQSEVEKFNRIASTWWALQGPFKALHALNPCRLAFIQSHATLIHKHVLDIGCGGGILAEGLAKAGAQVTGIDMAEAALQIAKTHAQHHALTIDYQHSTAEAFASQHAEKYDVITCMELLEHVPDPASLLQACYALLKPSGQLFISTLNRTPKAFLFAIVGAEYLLNLIPRGTHRYSQFIRPSELEACARQQGFTLAALRGVHYNPLTAQAALQTDVSVNYLAYFTK